MKRLKLDHDLKGLVNKGFQGLKRELIVFLYVLY